MEEFSQEIYNRYLLNAFVSTNMPFNMVTDDHFRRFLRLCNSQMRDPVDPPCASTMRNRLAKEYSLTIQAIRNELPHGTRKISLAMDGWTSPNKLPITSMLAYYIDDDWNLREVQLGFDEVN